MKFNKREFRSSVRRVLFNECGETLKTCTREQLSEAVNSCVAVTWPLYEDACIAKTGKSFDDLKNCVKDMFKGK